jgi:outer membrane lipoprotein-sorting protein
MKTLRAIGLSAALLAAAGATATLPSVAEARQARAAAGLSAADQALVNKAAAYLQSLGAAQGRFVQTDARGVTTQGAYYLKRPGKIRFEYAGTGMLVVADGSNVKIWDPRLKTFDQFPLGQTPLGVFLARNIRLDQGVRVEQVRKAADEFTVVARDARRPADGSIALTFDANATRLKEWTVTDAQGRRTRVQLTSLQPAGGLKDSLFTLRNPTARGGRPG